MLSQKIAEYFTSQLFRTSIDFIWIPRNLDSYHSSHFSWQKCHSASSLLSSHLENSWIWIGPACWIRADVAKPRTLVLSQVRPWKNQYNEDNNLSNHYCLLCNSCERIWGNMNLHWFWCHPQRFNIQVQPELINTLQTNPFSKQFSPSQTLHSSFASVFNSRQTLLIKSFLYNYLWRMEFKSKNL